MNASLSSDDAPMHREGPVARAIERQTTKIPSDLFLWGAAAAFFAAGALQLLGTRKLRWLRRAPVFLVARRLEVLAPMVLILGVYNKLVKVHGS
jgi:hypothetical protein